MEKLTQQPFKIETDALDYAVDVVLTQHGHLMAYHSEMLSNVVCKHESPFHELRILPAAQCKPLPQSHH